MEEPKELLIGFTKDSDGNWILNTHKDYEIKEVDGKFKLIPKQPQYPKTYEECARLINTYCGSIGGYNWKYCIPYEGNEHLLGTRNDCDEFFKTWE